MIPLPCCVLLMSLLAMRQAPAGTQLHVRLTMTVGSYATKAGTPVSAVLIAPVMTGGRVTLPAGSVFAGKVKMIRRVGLGIRHETAALELDFSNVILPDGDRMPVATRVIEVDNAREAVNQNGRIQGLRATNSPCYRISGYIRRLASFELHARLATWAVKSLITQLPEPEIYFPAGTELTLILTQPLLSKLSFAGGAHPPLESLERGGQERADLLRVVAAMPVRTYSAAISSPADITNVLLIGSRSQITAAFTAAGWAEAKPMTLANRIAFILATSESRGYRSAPMSPLFLNGAEADMSWQKSLNDVSKRHHIRLWRQSGDWQGRELWVGAATRDIQFAYLRAGQTFTHRVEENVDRVRERIAHDLSFTSCVNLLDWVERSDVPRVTENATGDPMTTDTRMVVVGLNDCRQPRGAVEAGDGPPLPVHGNTMQRLLRREILIARNDALRDNPIWRSYEVGRWIVSYVRRHKRVSVTTVAETLSNAPGPTSLQRPAGSSEATATPAGTTQPPPDVRD